MDSSNGNEQGERVDITVVRNPKRRVFFLNGDLVRIYHVNRGAGIITLYNMTKERKETASLIEFKKKRKRAYTIIESGRLLNCHHKHLNRLIKQGTIPPPMGELPGGRRSFHYLSYYSEDDILEIRQAMSEIHHGKKRKDGLITNNKVPTEQELKYAMGDGILMYTKTEDGRFIPIFNETI
jgi:hypothetical protein